jgi:hypothetical protein
VDEKTAIQALDRKDPVLPLSPGRAERHGFEYFRHGTLSLHAAFNTKTGEVLGKTTMFARQRFAISAAFLHDRGTDGFDFGMDEGNSSDSSRVYRFGESRTFPRLIHFPSW